MSVGSRGRSEHVSGITRTRVKERPNAIRQATAEPTQDKRALGRIRTYDTRFRKPMLYPLSYEGKRALTCAFACSTVHVTAQR
jgi:hypothetical protein